MNLPLFQHSVFILRILVILVFLDSQLIYSTSRVCQFLPSFPLFALWLGNAFKSVGWGHCRAHFIFFAAYSGGLLFPDWFSVFCKLSFPIFCLVLGVLGMRVNLVPVTSSWLEAKFSLSLFFQEAATVDMSEPFPTREETQREGRDHLLGLTSVSQASNYSRPYTQGKPGRRNLYLWTFTSLRNNPTSKWRMTMGVYFLFTWHEGCSWLQLRQAQPALPGPSGLAWARFSSVHLLFPGTKVKARCFLGEGPEQVAQGQSTQHI